MAKAKAVKVVTAKRAAAEAEGYSGKPRAKSTTKVAKATAVKAR